MTNDRCEPRFILGDREDAGVNPYFAARQTEGVCLLAFEHNEFPLSPLQIGDRRNSLSNPANEVIGGGIMTDRHLFFHLIKTAQAERRFLTRGNQYQLFSTGLTDGRASRQNGAQPDNGPKYK